jgi:hypothetical protein
LEIQLNDQERRALARLLTERKALMIETMEDTTQPDLARRAGSIELSVIESIVGKLLLRDPVDPPYHQDARTSHPIGESFDRGDYLWSY